MIRVVIVQDNESGELQIGAVDSTTGKPPTTGHSLSVVHAALDALMIQKIREELAAEKRVGLAAPDAIKHFPKIVPGRG